MTLIVGVPIAGGKTFSGLFLDENVEKCMEKRRLLDKLPVID